MTFKLITIILALFTLHLSADNIAATSYSCPSSSQFRSSLSRPSRLIKSNGRLRGILGPEDADFVIGMLIPVHSPLANSSGGKCSNTVTARGVERVDMLLYAIDCINSDPDLLPNVTLGYDIRDTCFSENVAIDEALDLLIEETDIVQPSSNVNNTKQTQSFLLGIVGATASSVSVPLATFLRPFNVTQVSYLSTTPLLNNRDRYQYFLRTVPPDNIQAAAMYHFALKLNWTLVSAVHSEDAYGSFAIREFRRMSIENDESVCIDVDESLDPSVTDSQVSQVVSRLLKESRANVVILFLGGINLITRFLEVLENTNTTKEFLFMASDSIVESPQTIERFEDLLSGMFAFHPHSNIFEPFESFYTSVNRGNNKRNSEWYTEDCRQAFREQHMACYDNASVARQTGYRPDVSGSLIVDALYSLAHGLDRYLHDNCAQPVSWDRTTQTCQGQNKSLTRRLLLEYVQSSNFTSPAGTPVSFDETGSKQGLYTIYNHKGNSRDGYNWTITATYNPMTHGIKLEVPHDGIQFGKAGQGNPIQSECMSCPPGSIFIRVQGTCCGECKPCLGNSSSVNNTCVECDLYQWGNDSLSGSTECVSVKPSYLMPSNVWGAVIIALSILGLILVIAVSVGMGIFWNTPVIKSSGREQMILLLLGILLCFLLPPFYVLQPSLGICIVQRFGLWFCFSLIFGALLVKLLRIARIFFQRKQLKQPRCIEPPYQIIFTLLIVAGQVVLAVISLIVKYPLTTTDFRANETNSDGAPTLILTCQSPLLVMVILLVVYDTILIVINNILAILTIRFPENFSEARQVSFSTIAIAIVWLGFIPSYFATQIEFRAGVTAFAVLTTAFAVLLCIFGPRVVMATWYRWKGYKKDQKESKNNSVNLNSVSNDQSFKISSVSKSK